MQQGEIREVFQRNFYRAKEVTPLVSVTFTDATYTSVQDLNIHRQRLQDPTSIKETNTSGNVSIYPNPAKDILSVSLNEVHSTDLKYSIVNMNGQQVLSGNLDAKGKTDSQIALPGNIATGIYFISISNGAEKIATEMFYVEK